MSSAPKAEMIDHYTTGLLECINLLSLNIYLYITYIMQKEQNEKKASMFFGSFLRLIGIEFWIVAIGPFIIGWGISAKTIFPEPTTLFNLMIGLVVIGPLIGGFTFLINAYYDMLSDFANPRKTQSMILKGLIKPNTTFKFGVCFCILGVLLSLIVSKVFTLLILFAILLSLLYSHPKTKFKARCGLDILTNMVGLGIICPLAGWVVSKPDNLLFILNFPPLQLLASFLIIGGLYAPTTVADYNADKIANLRTLAVKLGREKTLILGFVLLTLGVIILVLMGVFNIFPYGNNLFLTNKEGLPLPVVDNIFYGFWPFIVIQPFFYLWFFFKNPDYSEIFSGLFLLATTQGIAFIIYMFYYSEILPVPKTPLFF